MNVIGWTSCYLTNVPVENFTEEHRQALIQCIKRRHYNFNYSDHQILPYCSPCFNTGCYCILTRQQWDSVMEEAYAEMPYGPRLMPQDVIKNAPENDILLERKGINGRPI